MTLPYRYLGWLSGLLGTMEARLNTALANGWFWIYGRRLPCKGVDTRYKTKNILDSKCNDDENDTDGFQSDSVSYLYHCFTKADIVPISE